MQVTEILTDHTLMALDLQGAEDYPIRFYLDIMDQFDRAGIHWHWHPAPEFNVVTKGTMEYFVENEHHTLTAGQGIGGAASPFLMGLISDSVGTQSAYLMLALFGVVGTLCYLVYYFKSRATAKA